MIQLWAVYAFSSAVLWGIAYALSERLLRLGLTPSFLMLVMAIASAPIYFLFASYAGSIKGGSEILIHNRQALLLLALIVLSITTGNFLIMSSIESKNATLASLIEVSYPLFIFLVAWLVFKDFQLTMWSAFGGVLIFMGIGIITLKS